MLQRRVAPPHQLCHTPRGAFALSGAQRDACCIRVSPRLQPAAARGSSGHRTYVRSVWVWLAYGGHYETGDAYVHVEELPLALLLLVYGVPWPVAWCPGDATLSAWISQLLRVCSAPGTRVGHEGSFHMPLVGTEYYVLLVQYINQRRKIIMYCDRQEFQRYCSRQPAGMFRLVFPSFGGGTC